MKYIYHTIISIIFLLFISCNKYEFYTSTGVKIIYPTGSELYLNENSNYLFNQDSLFTLELEIPKKALEYIDANPVAKEYIEGSLTLGKETISPIRIRYKGARGQFWSSLSGKNPNNPTGYKTATKLSLRLKFNETGLTGTFYGLKNLQLHSLNNDKSQLRERLAYKLYRDMGVPAPRCVHVKLIINGTYYGLYALTENIDEDFLANNFSDASGNLYKDVWPIKSTGISSSSREFFNGLETNINAKADVHIIKSFADDIAKSEYSQSMEIVKRRMNVISIVSYIIVDRTIRNDDGAFMWYGSSNHNYFWYETPSDKLVHLIPWDMDAAFKKYSENNKTSDCKMFYKNEWNIANSNICDKLSCVWAMFKEEHEERINYFLVHVFEQNRIDYILDEWFNQIEQATIDAAEIHADAPSYETWKQAVLELKSNINQERILLQSLILQ